jgi:hypothetical protein
MSPEFVARLVTAAIPFAFGILFVLSAIASRNEIRSVEENPSSGSG